jgi:F-type H+-transporting ATPase subunit alpha
MNEPYLSSIAESAGSDFERTLEGQQARIASAEFGTVEFVGKGIARVSGLPHVKADEILEFAGGTLGMAFNLDRQEIGVVMLDAAEQVEAGSEVHGTGRVLDTPVGDALLGRVLDALGRPLDAKELVRGSERFPVERDAPGIMQRAPVTEPLQTGLKVIDALIPIGRGQRELIVGDRQTGKTAIAIDTFINQRDKDVICIYCAIGQRSSAVAKVVAKLRETGAMDYSIVLVASGEDAPGLQFACPYSAMSIGEHFMSQGRDVLVVFDDLTRHAQAYRELSLLLRRPPGREAYPGDIFYIHSRLLERATHLREEHGGGSLTALPVVETEAQNISAYIPTNLISITDGQIYLSPSLFRKGILPAVDVGKSVSRVGGKTQLPVYRGVAGDLRLSYSQFEELETFARFGTRLDEDTRKTLAHGRVVRQILKQSQYDPIPVAEQIAALLAASEGVFDALPLDRVGEAEQAVRDAFGEELPDIYERIGSGEKLSDGDREAILKFARERCETFKEKEDGDGHG